MGAGQVGGIATLLDLDFKNAAGFVGETADQTEAQFLVYYLSHAMLFCVGALIEPHVVLTPAICVFGEKYKFDIFGGTHKFVENSGSPRVVENLCIHKKFNRSGCFSDNIALLVLKKQFSFRERETNTEFIINRVRYGVPVPTDNVKEGIGHKCQMYGWGSRRNGYLIPLLLSLRKADVMVLPSKHCDTMWNHDRKFLCIEQPQCKDDVGSLVVCGGFAHGMLVSRLVDRPCGVGFLDLTLYDKFLTCGVDDSRDVVDYDAYHELDAASHTSTFGTAAPDTSIDK